MSKQTVDIGSSANDGTGDSIRNGGDKINDNFTELYNALGNGTTIAANTGTLASNAYLISSYQSNTQITSRLRSNKSTSRFSFNNSWSWCCMVWFIRKE